MAEPAGMEFPTFFRLRIVGLHSDDFPEFLLDTLLPLIPDLTAERLELRPSSNGRYLAVHVLFTADSREQLDSIYSLLSAHERVLWVM